MVNYISKISDRLKIEDSKLPLFYYPYCFYFDHYNFYLYEGLISIVTYEYFTYYLYFNLNYLGAEIINEVDKNLVKKDILLFFNKILNFLEQLRFAVEYDDDALIHLYKTKMRLEGGESVDLINESKVILDLYEAHNLLESDEEVTKGILKSNLTDLNKKLLDIIDNISNLDDMCNEVYYVLNNYLYMLESIINELVENRLNKTKT